MGNLIEDIIYPSIFVAIIIPIYKDYKDLTSYEKLSLSQCFSILKNYVIILVKPKSLNIDGYISFIESESQTEEFDDFYFKNISGYNALMLSSNFYNRFLKYEYLLIYQLDAFVFADELLYWCNQGYDYIGAPWLVLYNFDGEEKKRYEKKVEHAYIFNEKQENSTLHSHLQFYNRVGNGGFSLRRTEYFYKIAIEMNNEIEIYLRNDWHPYFNEDVFWSLEVNRKEKRLNIPDFKKACLFSLESHIFLGFKYNNLDYPFGCHGWNKRLNIWRPIFKYAGYNI